MMLYMIARIKGPVIDLFERGVVVDTGSIGYLVYTPTLYSVGDVVVFYTHLVIRDDAHELYGFQDPGEKILFMHLISVSGVGPKTALQMLTMYPMSELVRAIRNGDAKAVSLVPGIGKKTAEKVIIDLKDKLAGFATTEQSGSNDLVEALLSLGFKDHDIRSVLPTIDTDLVLEKQITTALQLLKK
jgi:Holliday junction DNA helicase RuvA